MREIDFGQRRRWDGKCRRVKREGTTLECVKKHVFEDVKEGER